MRSKLFLVGVNGLSKLAEMVDEGDYPGNEEGEKDEG
jgi:hypothetical protein